MVAWWEVAKDALLVVAGAVWLAGWLVFMASQLAWLYDPCHKPRRRQAPWWFLFYAGFWHAVWPLRLPLNALREAKRPKRSALERWRDVFANQRGKASRAPAPEDCPQTPLSEDYDPATLAEPQSIRPPTKPREGDHS